MLCYNLSGVQRIMFRVAIASRCDTHSVKGGQVRIMLQILTSLFFIRCGGADAGEDTSDVIDGEDARDTTTPEVPYVSGLYYMVDPGVDRPQREEPDSSKGCRCWQHGDVCTITLGYDPRYPPDPDFRCPEGEVCAAPVPGPGVCRWACFHPDAAHVENFDCPVGEMCRVMQVTGGFEDAGLTTQGFCAPFNPPIAE